MLKISDTQGSYIGTIALQRLNSPKQCFFCITIFSGTHILINDWRPQYSTSLRQ